MGLSREEVTRRILLLPADKQAEAAKLASEIFGQAEQQDIMPFRDFIRGAWPILEPAQRYVGGWHIDCICEYLEAINTGQIRKLVIAMPPRHGKPVCVDELIQLESGKRVRLGDVGVGDKVLTHRGRFRSVTAVHAQGALECLKITVHSGRTVISALDHPFFTPGGLREARDLHVGERLAVVCPEQIKEQREQREIDECRFAGYIIGDGSVSHNTGMFSLKKHWKIDDILERASRLGFVNSVNGGKIHLNTSARDWLDRHRLRGCDSYTKHTPSFIFQSGQTGAAEYIAGYFDCDGTMNAKGLARVDLCLSITSVNRSLLDDVQHLLLKLGIQCRIRTRTREGYLSKKQPGDTYTYHLLEIAGFDAAARMLERIPIGGDKLTRLQAWNPSRTIFDSNLIPDEIVSIEAVGKRECACLTVDEDESFAPNDIAVHNSSLVSVLWPAHTWTYQPTKQFLMASYSRLLSTRDSVKCRSLIASPWYQMRWGHVFEMTRDQNQKMRFQNNKGGIRISTSVSGSGIGEGGDCIVVDDSIKANNIYSDRHRENVISWWDQEMATRGNNPTTCAFVVVGQRLHEGDLSGHLIKRGDYEVLNLPARYEADRKSISLPSKIGFKDPRTKQGELLWPAQFPEAEIRKLEKTLGPYAASAQLQQRPTPAGGGLFKVHWWRYWRPAGDESFLPVEVRREKDGEWVEIPVVDLPEKFEEKILSCDFSFKDTAESDYVVMQVWGLNGANRYLLYQMRGRMDFVESKRVLVELSRMFPDAVTKLVEDKANGPAIIAALRDQIEGLTEVDPCGGKIARANAMQGIVASLNVFIPHPELYPWVGEFRHEHSLFPKGNFDDQVDANSQAQAYFSGMGDEFNAWGGGNVVTESLWHPLRMN